MSPKGYLLNVIQTRKYLLLLFYNLSQYTDSLSLHERGQNIYSLEIKPILYTINIKN